MTDTNFITQVDQKRFLTEILGDGPLSENDVRAACDRLSDMYVDAAALNMWHRGELVMGFDPSTQDLTWRATSKGESNV